MSKKAEPSFKLINTFLLDCSVEVKKPIYALDQSISLKPNISYQMQHKQQDSIHEVIMTVSIDVEHEKEPALLIEAKQCGCFDITGYDEKQMNMILKAECPTIIFPYLRERVSNLITSTGYPLLYLDPINFHATEEAKSK